MINFEWLIVFKNKLLHQGTAGEILNNIHIIIKWLEIEELKCISDERSC